MSSDDRSKVLDTACKCGKGKFQIEAVTPDHPWARASQTRYEATIECDICTRTLEIVRQGDSFYSVSRDTVLERRDKREKSRQTFDDFQRDAKVDNALSLFAEYLDNQTSVAAVYRVLKGLSFEIHTLPTFRKRWRDSKTWIATYGKHVDLERILDALEIEDKELRARLAEAKAQKASSNEPFRNLGAPLYTVR